MPFLIVQLAPFGTWLGANGNNFPEVRAKQDIVCKTVPNCWLASIMDVGDEKDIHPKDKRPVGERFALLARNKVYGENLLSEAPEFTELTMKKGEVSLKFANAGDGLEIRGESLQALDVTVDGELIQEWTAYADGDKVILSSEKFESGKKIQVKYAWTAFCVVNLYNSAGLAAKPFQEQV
ncbi:MAG: hypothetical protein IJ091_05670 [Oscillospiraceae bacterium]|nr:hypothetical protein [Oscillospiraceae bacterium]